MDLAQLLNELFIIARVAIVMALLPQRQRLPRSFSQPEACFALEIFSDGMACAMVARSGSEIRR